jgi:hypothetical protein
LDQGTWRRLTHSLPGADRSVDFGIWGNLLVYKAISTEYNDLTGVYLTAPTAVELYKQVFEVAWKQADAPPPPAIQTPMPLSELFRGRFLEEEKGRL